MQGFLNAVKQAVNSGLRDSDAARKMLRQFHLMQGFLNAVKQEVNRKHASEQWTLDDVVMSAEVLHPAKEVEQIREPPNEGISPWARQWTKRLANGKRRQVLPWSSIEDGNCK